MQICSVLLLKIRGQITLQNAKYALQAIGETQRTFYENVRKAYHGKKIAT